MSNLISSTAILSKRFLADEFTARMDDDLANRRVQIKGYNIDIKRYGEVQVSAVAKCILIQVPLEVHMTKPEGVFTVEGHAAMSLEIRVDIDIFDDWQVQTTTQLQDYTWLIEPTVKLGVVKIPLEMIVDAAIRKKEKDIAQQVDETIAAQLDLRALVADQAERLARGIALAQGLVLTGVVQKVQVSYLKEDAANIFLHLLPTVEVLVRPSNLHSFKGIPTMPAMEWIFDQAVETTHSQEVLVELTYDFISDLLKQLVDDLEVGGKELQVTEVNVGFTDRLQVTLTTTTPVPAKVHVSGQPSYDHDSGQFDLAGIDVKVKPSNFIYRLSAPLINRLIEHRMEALLPIPIETKINEVWEEKKATLPQFKHLQYTIDISRISVSAVSFLVDKVVAGIEVDQPEVEVKIA